MCHFLGTKKRNNRLCSIIPLWFRSFKGKTSDAFQEQLIMDGISYVCELFGSDYDAKKESIS